VPHAIRYLMPSATNDAAAVLTRALARAGRPATHVQPLPVDRRLPPLPDGTLRWTVRALTGDTGLFLMAQDAGPTRWDLVFARALSAEADGFVVVLDVHPNRGRFGEALFFAGRTIQARSWNAGEGNLDAGPPLMDSERRGTHVAELYEQRFALLCDPDTTRLSAGRLLLAEDWNLPEPWAAFDSATEALGALILASGAPTTSFLATLAPEWRARRRRTRGLGLPYVELRRDGPLDEAVVVNLSRDRGTAVGVELSGGGGSYRWAEAWDGVLRHHGATSGSAGFLRTLSAVSAALGEPLGQLFGCGAGMTEAET
jgi:hypothetical protein